MSHLGCQQTSCLSINLTLNSCSLVFLNSFPNFLILLFLCPLTPTNTARNLGVIFDSSLTFSSQNISHPCQNHAFYPRDLRRIRNTLDYSTAQTIVAMVSLSFIARSTTVSLSFSIFLAVNLIAFNLFSTPQLELFLKPLASAISHPSTNLYTGSKLIIASSTKFSRSLTYKTLQSKKPFYLYSLLNLQANTSTRSSNC